MSAFLLLAVSVLAATSTSIPKRSILKRSATLSAGGPGPATNYDTTPAPGACGWQNTNWDYVVALNPSEFQHAFCGKLVEITVPTTGTVVRAMVADLCGAGGTCGLQFGIDTSNVAFRDLGGDIAGDMGSTSGFGNVPVTWVIYDEDFAPSPGSIAEPSSEWKATSQSKVTSDVQQAPESSWTASAAIPTNSEYTSVSVLNDKEVKARVEVEESLAPDVIASHSAAAPSSSVSASFANLTLASAANCTNGETKCSSESKTWALCSNGAYVDMGRLAEGTDCPTDGATTNRTSADAVAHENLSPSMSFFSERASATSRHSNNGLNIIEAESAASDVTFGLWKWLVLIGIAHSLTLRL